MGKIIDVAALSRFKTKFIEKVLDTEGRGIHFGTETNYPLSAAHTAYPMGVTLIYTAASTSYPYGTGTVVTIRSASARCVQYNVGNTPNNYKLRTADSSGWSDWKSLKDVPGITDLQKAIGIVVDGNKAATAVTLGQFVILKNSTISGRADGLYTAAKAIPANTAIDSTYLTAVSGGGLNVLRNTLLYCEHIICTPSNNLSAGQYGYYEVPVKYAKGKNIIATSITILHPSFAGGYSLNGGYIYTLDFVYIGYYTPRAITASNADFVVDIVYTDFPVTTNSHNETV